MNILTLNIQVDKLPDGCSVNMEDNERCVFNCWKYCILKMALKQGDTFVQNNRGIVPDDCPLKTGYNLPISMEKSFPRNEMADAYTEGWNDCLKEMGIYNDRS